MLTSLFPSKQLAELHYAVLDLFQNEEEPQTVPPPEEPVSGRVTNLQIT